MPDPTPTAFAPLGGIAVALAVELAAIALVRWGQRRRGLTPGGARKALHVATSAVALSLPWLFDATWPVVVLAALGVAVGLASRASPRLRRAVGPALRATGPETVGDLAFPIAVAVLYALTASEPVLYAIPLLLLGLADPAAALAEGRRGGGEGTSREAAVAFAAVAFLCVHVPLLVFTPTGRPESLWVAAIVAVLVTLLRGASWQGLDNLFVPLGAYAVLVRLLTLTAPRLAGHAVALAVLVGTAALLRRSSTVGGDGVFGVALVGYLLWALGGTAWLLTPGLFYILYDRVWPGGGLAEAGRDELEASDARPHTVQNVFSVAAVGMLWLVASRALGTELLAPFCLAWGVTFGFTGVERMRRSRPRWGAVRMGAEAAWRGALVTAAPLALVWGLRALAGTEAAPEHLGVSVVAAAGLAAVAVGAGAAVLARWGRVIDDESSAFAGRVYRAALVLPLSALALAVG